MKKFKKNSLLIVIAASLLTTIILLLGGTATFGESFFQDFSANWLATFLGVIVGIPVVLWTTNYQEKTAEKERRAKILRLLREELLVDLTQLSGWQKSKIRDIEVLTLSGMLKVESWKAFSDGGELEWIKDPDLLSKLSWAYSSIQIVIYVSEKYFSLGFLGETRGDKRQLVNYLQAMLEKGVEDSCSYITEALKAIGGPT